MFLAPTVAQAYFLDSDYEGRDALDIALEGLVQMSKGDGTKDARGMAENQHGADKDEL